MSWQPRDAQRPLLVLRHGATQANLDGLRCGGDLDVPLTAEGRTQVAQAARRMRNHGWKVDTVFASDLQRTRESAAIAADILGVSKVRVVPALRERLLGEWNLTPVAETEGALRAGATPPRGESSTDFRARIEGALSVLQSQRSALPLLIGSRGVARVLRELLGLPAASPLANGELLGVDLAPRWAAEAMPLERALP